MKWMFQSLPGNEIFDVGYGWHPSRKPMLFDDAEEAWAFAERTFEKPREQLQATMRLAPMPEPPRMVTLP